MRGAEPLIDLLGVKQQLLFHGVSLPYLTTAPLTRLVVMQIIASRVAPVTTLLIVTGHA